ncbi:hypothetical protein [Archaeoglobus sp.]
MIYGVFINIPEKYSKLEDDVRKTIGYGIADGDVLTFTEAKYKGDKAFVLLVRSRRSALKVVDDFKKYPIHAKIIEIEGRGD